MLLHYYCPECEHVWDDTYDCLIDAKCPQCGEEKITPIDYEEDFSLSLQERNTILAALRWYQHTGMAEIPQQPIWLHNIATNCHEAPPLDADEIDVLCERLNVPDPDEEEEDEESDETSNL